MFPLMFSQYSPSSTPVESTELSALDRKIQLELAPPTPVSEEQEKKQDLDTFKLETIHTVNPNKDFIYIRPENGYNKGRKI